MTADAALLTREARTRLLERVRELDELARLMRQPSGLAEAPEPVPLHRAGRDTTEKIAVSRSRPDTSRTRSLAC